MPPTDLRVIVRGCHNLIPFRRLVEERKADLPAGVEPGLLPCSSKVEAHHILKFIEQGADGVLILACPMGACRLVEGNRRAAKRVAWAADWIEELGLERQRVRFLAMEPDQVDGVDRIIEDFYRETAKLGPTPVTGRNPQRR